MSVNAFPLPSFRYVPGEGPHPGLHGHVPEVDCQQWLAYGIHLYDAHYWWESHEVWEALWRTLAGAERQAVQGLVQTSATHLLRRMERTQAAQTMQARARERLGAIPADLVLQGIPMKPVAERFLRELAA